MLLKLQYSCLENSMDRGAWQAIVHGVPKGMTQLSDKHCHTSHTEDQRQIFVPVKLSTCLLNAGMLIELILLPFIRCYFFFLKYLQCCLWIFSGNILCPHLWQSKCAYIKRWFLLDYLVCYIPLSLTFEITGS